MRTSAMMRAAQKYYALAGSLADLLDSALFLSSSFFLCFSTLLTVKNTSLRFPSVTVNASKGGSFRHKNSAENLFAKWQYL